MGKCSVRNDQMIPKDGIIRIVTISFPALNPNLGKYYRLLLYEFTGDPLTAHFVKDLGVGFWMYILAVEAAFMKADALGITYVPHISMGDPIDKVFKQALG